MKTKKEKKDKQFSLIIHVISRLFEPSKRFIEPYINEGMVVADLGSGPGYYTLHFAKKLGSEGRVYAVDSDKRAIKALERKKVKRGFQNIDAHVGSASDLSFIKDESVDFIFANGLLCCVAPKQQESAVNEIIRILKPDGLAYLSVARGSISYMTDENWEKYLKKFDVKKRKDKRTELTAEVSKKTK